MGTLKDEKFMSKSKPFKFSNQLTMLSCSLADVVCNMLYRYVSCLAIEL